MPVGLGFDIHRLVPGRRLLLGGVSIDHPYGLLGHSDGDVVLHAVTDALLGATGGGDIGERFPDTDPRWKGIASEVFVKKVVEDHGGSITATKPEGGGTAFDLRLPLAERGPA